jgi:hypothetical protein
MGEEDVTTPPDLVEEGSKDQTKAEMKEGLRVINRKSLHKERKAVLKSPQVLRKMRLLLFENIDRYDFI